MHDFIASCVPIEKDWVLSASGAAACGCPFDYAADDPLLPFGSNPLKLEERYWKISEHVWS